MDFNQVFMSKVKKVIVVFALLTAFLSIKNDTFAQVDSVASLPVDSAVANTSEVGSAVAQNNDYH